LQLAIYYGEANICAILISANSIFVAVFAGLIFKEKITKIKVASMFLGLCGITLIILNQSTVSADAINPTLGIIFGSLSSITFALYTVISKKYIKHYGNLITNSYSFIIGSIILLVISLCNHKDMSFCLNTRNLLFIGYLGIFISGIAYLTYFEGLKRVSTTIGSMFFFLKPVIVAILAYFIFGETLNTIQIIGIIIVIAGLNLDFLKPIPARIHNRIRNFH
jgi:drug/metabolite transporter (DMT)-like permease